MQGKFGSALPTRSLLPHGLPAVAADVPRSSACRNVRPIRLARWLGEDPVCHASLAERKHGCLLGALEY